MNTIGNYPQGIIEIGSDLANELGFTADKFAGYLWLDGDRVYISFIVSLNQNMGNLSALFNRIEEMGYRVAVPTPLGKMELILRRKGFVRHYEPDEYMGEASEVWEKPL